MNAARGYVNMVEDYVNFLVKDYVDLLKKKKHTSALMKLFKVINEQGRINFKKDYKPIQSHDVVAEIFIEQANNNDVIANKPTFLAKVRKDYNMKNDDEDEDGVLDDYIKYAAFNDSLRHATFVDISDKTKPKRVDPPAGVKLSDYVVLWESVDEFPSKLPDHVILVNLENIENLFFPVPEVARSGGGRRKRKTRRRRRARATTQRS